MSEKYPTSGTTSGSGSSSTYHVSTPFLSEKGSASGSGHGYPLPYTDLYIEDDELHDIERDSRNGSRLDSKGILNMLTVFLIFGGIVMLFLGYPVIEFARLAHSSTKGGYNVGGTNGTGQIPAAPVGDVRFDLIDPDTPDELRSKMSIDGNTKMNLVFSDEFNKPGRSFWPGDDPFWTAVELWPWATADYEYYHPSAVTTEDGSLVITADQIPTNNLNFRSGQITTWNQFCFTGGYVETRVQLPGSSSVSGWWPAIWTMGNLGRANYGATTQGTWPYAYSACDVGTLRNQTTPDGLGPDDALTTGDTVYNNKYDTTSISWQPGQRLSACTCPGEDHPGPKDDNGNFVGRSAPEIDVFEAQVSGGKGGVSQSGQWMPANSGYHLINTTGNEYEFFQDSAKLNEYQGNVLQQSASGVADTNQRAYQYSGGEFAVYGFEYEAGPDGYITWINDGEKSWTLRSGALAADPRVGIARRPVPEEPMYLIMNLAISSGFGTVEFDNLEWPGKMSVDYIRVYQPEGKENIGCDPDNFPTAAYIERHAEAYNNPNLTTWGGTRDTGGYGEPWPRNRLYPDGCTNPASVEPGPNPPA